MLGMIGKHAEQQMLTAGVRIGEVARHFEVSRRTIERIRKEPAVEGDFARWPNFVEPLQPEVSGTPLPRTRAIERQGLSEGYVTVFENATSLFTGSLEPRSS